MMQAIGFTGARELTDADAFVSYNCEMPAPIGHDLLVAVKAVSVNPVDTKVRMRTSEPQDPPRILGWDAAGIVQAVGSEVTLFEPGDEVFYAGDITRPGSNASHQLVDERIVGHKPKSLDFAHAVALPLTAITAWEALFERLGIDPESDAGKRILIIGGAGGVGSIAIQLARKVANLEVIATASRDASRDWCLSLGASYVINHYHDLKQALALLNMDSVDYILCLHDTDHYFPVMAELIAPQGMICSIVETTELHDLDVLKSKSAGFVWEFMFTRSMYQTEDMIRQHELLNQVADLVDAGLVNSTLNNLLGGISAGNIARAHELLETGRSIGKTVLDGMTD
jgi:alcohol dehydrogenase